MINQPDSSKIGQPAPTPTATARDLVRHQVRGPFAVFLSRADDASQLLQAVPVEIDAVLTTSFLPAGRGMLVELVNLVDLVDHFGDAEVIWERKGVFRRREWLRGGQTEPTGRRHPRKATGPASPRNAGRQRKKRGKVKGCRTKKQK